MLFSGKYKTPCQAEKEFAQNAVYILNNIWNMGVQNVSDLFCPDI